MRAETISLMRRRRNSKISQGNSQKWPRTSQPLSERRRRRRILRTTGDRDPSEDRSGNKPLEPPRERVSHQLNFLPSLERRDCRHRLPEFPVVFTNRSLNYASNGARSFRAFCFGNGRHRPLPVELVDWECDCGDVLPGWFGTLIETGGWRVGELGFQF